LKIGPYAVSLEGLPSLGKNVFDSLRVRVRGIPPAQGDNPVEISRDVIRKNARKVLWAGQGHFHYMWVSDFAKAFRGLTHAVSPSYARGLIDYMIRESFRKGRVTSCFTADHGFDMPYYRADNLPLLVYSVAEYCRWVGDRRLLEEGEAALQWLISRYEETHFKDGLLDPDQTGDWMDTVLRPSSTYNNVCALMMLKTARSLGLKTRMEPGELEKALLKARWRGDHFTDYAGTDRLSVDGGVLALYFGLFDASVRDALVKRFEGSELVAPFPIKASPEPYEQRLLPLISKFSSGYHSAIWLHLGIMYANGLKRNGKPYTHHKAKFDALIMKHRHVLEAFDGDGEIYQTPFHSTEYGLSMAAGQYLELALD
jgi:hypothetical protein